MSIRAFGFLLTTFLIATVILVPGLFDDLFALLIIGIVPNTNYAIPSPIMFTLYALLIMLCLRSIIVQSNTLLDTRKHEIAARKKARLKVYRTVHYAPPKRRRSTARKHQRRAIEA